MTPDDIVTPEEQRIIRERHHEGPDSIIAALAVARGTKRRGNPNLQVNKDTDDRCKRALVMVANGYPRKAVHMAVADDAKTQKAVKRRLDNFYADDLRAAEKSFENNDSPIPGIAESKV